MEIIYWPFVSKKSSTFFFQWLVYGWMLFIVLYPPSLGTWLMVLDTLKSKKVLPECFIHPNPQMRIWDLSTTSIARERYWRVFGACLGLVHVSMWFERERERVIAVVSSKFTRGVSDSSNLYGSIGKGTLYAWTKRFFGGESKHSSRHDTKVTETHDGGG